MPVVLGSCPDDVEVVVVSEDSEVAVVEESAPPGVLVVDDPVVEALAVVDVAPWA
ncbi:MAG TPA: hypothetical protein VJR05_14900 [Acidimicrobiia bacterium]|nr:hypothetical protein [Acidimicrobiia bacterium]